MQKIEIKPYQENYKDQIIQMILKIQKEEFSFPVTLKDQPDIEDVSLFYLKGHGNFWVALSDDIIVGTLGLLDIGNSQGALRKMFVVKEYRGEGKNIAKLLLDALLEWCKIKNINEIYLGTVETFIAAQRFYKKNGFIEIDKSKLPKSFSIMPFDSQFYLYRAEA